LFSESNSRFVVSVAPEKAAELEALFVGLPIEKIGSVTEARKLVVAGSINADVDALVKPFKETLYGV
jgi:phosphoribosylformylglycinamidine synthase